MYSFSITPRNNGSRFRRGDSKTPMPDLLLIGAPRNLRASFRPSWRRVGAVRPAPRLVVHRDDATGIPEADDGGDACGACDAATPPTD
jgi:hypothetical protein